MAAGEGSLIVVVYFGMSRRLFCNARAGRDITVVKHVLLQPDRYEAQPARPKRPRRDFAEEYPDCDATFDGERT